MVQRERGRGPRSPTALRRALQVPPPIHAPGTPAPLRPCARPAAWHQRPATKHKSQSCVVWRLRRAAPRPLHEVDHIYNGGRGGFRRPSFRAIPLRSSNTLCHYAIPLFYAITPAHYSIPLFCTIIACHYSVPLFCTIMPYDYSIPLLHTITPHHYSIPVCSVLILYTATLYHYSIPLCHTITVSQSSKSSKTVLHPITPYHYSAHTLSGVIASSNNWAANFGHLLYLPFRLPMNKFYEILYNCGCAGGDKILAMGVLCMAGVCPSAACVVFWRLAAQTPGTTNPAIRPHPDRALNACQQGRAAVLSACRSAGRPHDPALCLVLTDDRGRGKGGGGGGEVRKRRSPSCRWGPVQYHPCPDSTAPKRQ